MIKVPTAEEVLELLRQGKDIYYFDIESKDIAPLSKALESVPGVFLIEENSVLKSTPSPSNHKVSTEDYPEKTKVKKTRKNKPGPKPSIDLGKVKALHRAGWSNLKIADEMGVCPATICYHLKRMKDEVQDEGHKGAR